MTLRLIVSDCINIDERLGARGSAVEVLSRDPFDDLEDFHNDTRVTHKTESHIVSTL